MPCWTRSRRCNYADLFVCIDNNYSFIQAISVAPLQVRYSEALLTKHGSCVGVSRPSATGNCAWRTCPRSLYVAARAGFEPATIRTKGVEYTNAPPRPTYTYFASVSLLRPLLQQIHRVISRLWTWEMVTGWPANESQEKQQLLRLRLYVL